MKIPNKDDIEKIATFDSTVNACLQAQRQPQSGITYEQALMAMVAYLVGDKNAALAKANDCLQKHGYNA